MNLNDSAFVSISNSESLCVIDFFQGGQFYHCMRMDQTRKSNVRPFFILKSLVFSNCQIHVNERSETLYRALLQHS